jgi:hypothetical protein
LIWLGLELGLGLGLRLGIGIGIGIGLGLGLGLGLGYMTEIAVHRLKEKGRIQVVRALRDLWPCRYRTHYSEYFVYNRY